MPMHNLSTHDTVLATPSPSLGMGGGDKVRSSQIITWKISDVKRINQSINHPVCAPPITIPPHRKRVARMVSTQTTNARDKKQAEQKRLIEETEKEIGRKEDHPEDELILGTRYP
jgi:hypothetical protein